MNWYRGIKADFSDTDTLLRTQRHLAGLLFAFAAELGQLYRQKNGAEFQRRAAFARAKQAGISRDESAAKAEAAAQLEIEDLLKREFEADAEYKAAWLLYESARDTLSAMVQHISHLKAEKRAETHGTGSQG